MVHLPKNIQLHVNLAENKINGSSDFENPEFVVSELIIFNSNNSIELTWT